MTEQNRIVHVQIISDDDGLKYRISGLLLDDNIIESEDDVIW